MGENPGPNSPYDTFLSVMLDCAQRINAYKLGALNFHEDT